MPPARLGCRSVAFTYNDPVIFMEYAIDVADACRERGLQAGGRHRRLHLRRAPRRVLPAHGRRQRRPQGVHRGVLQARHRRPPRSRCSTRSSTCATRPTSGSRSPTSSSPATTTATPSSRRMSAWIAEHLGPDVPLHFTAFHPDFKMLDVPHTPPATLTRARDIARRHGLRYVYTGNVHDTAGCEHVLPGLRPAWWSSATGTCSARTTSPTTAAAGPAARRSPGATTGRPARGVPGASRCGWTRRRRRSRRDDGHGGVAVVTRAARAPAVAGCFYPAEPDAAPDRRRAARRSSPPAADRRCPPPKAIIAPHAGYRYSGPVAATAYATLAPAARSRAPGRHRRSRPLHAGRRRSPSPAPTAFATPLGPVTRRRRCPPPGARRARRRRRRRGPRRRAQSRGAPPVPHRRCSVTSPCCRCSSGGRAPPCSPTCSTACGAAPRRAS